MLGLYYIFPPEINHYLKKMLTQKNLSSGQSKQISDANLLQKKSIDIKETALLTISNPMLI